MSDIEDDITPPATGATSAPVSHHAIGSTAVPIGTAPPSSTTGTCRSGAGVGTGTAKAGGNVAAAAVAAAAATPAAATAATAAPTRDAADVVDGLENSPVVAAF